MSKKQVRSKKSKITLNEEDKMILDYLRGYNEFIGQSNAKLVKAVIKLFAIGVETERMKSKQQEAKPND